MIESLDVILWDKKVGTLVANREGHRSKACFYFDSDYVRNGYDIAPLRAPVKGVAAQRGRSLAGNLRPLCASGGHGPQ